MSYWMKTRLAGFRFIDIAPGLGVAYAPDRSRRWFDPDNDVQVELPIKGSVNF